MAKKESSIIAGRLVRSYLSSVISISLVLFLVGIVCFFAVNARKVSDFFKENAVVSVILKPEATEEQAIELEGKLSEAEFVKSAEYISKEQGYQEMKSLLGDDFLKVFEVNPIPISIDIKVKGDFFEKDSLGAIKCRIEGMPLVREVTYQESLVEMLNANLNKIGIVLAIFITLLLFISFVLIGNTVRLSVFAKRFSIHTMRLVGAKRRFIRKPFIIHAFWEGLASGLIADLCLFFLMNYAEREFGNLFVIFDPMFSYAIFVVVPLVGMMICMISAYFVVNRVAYMSKDDLYY